MTERFQALLDFKSKLLSFDFDTSPPEELHVKLQKNVVVVLSGNGENDAINFIMRSVSGQCQKCGLEVEYFDMARFGKQDSDRLLNTVSSGKVRMGLSYLGIGQDLQVETLDYGGQNLWGYFNIPLLKLHGDMPAYFLDRHRDNPINCVNLYPCEEFLDFHKMLFPDSSCVSAIFDPWLMYDAEEEKIDFSARENGKLFFLKNNRSPASLQAYWKNSLPPQMGKQMHDLSSEILAVGLTSGKTNIFEVVLSFFTDQKIDIRRNNPLLCFYVTQMDDYLRRVKAEMISQALLAFPVVIVGSGWGYLDTAGALATVAPAKDLKATEELYRTQLGVIDMSPNVDTICHDRLARAAGTYSFALTNKTAWLGNTFPALNDAAFEFHPDHIRSAVNEALKDPAGCIELGRQYGRAFRAKYDSVNFVDRLLAVAEMARIRDARPFGCMPG